MCASPLAQRGGTLACDTGHSFDIAKQGYVDLTGGRAHKGTADTAEMVAARVAFLESGHFLPIANAVVEAAVTAVGDQEGLIVDAGAGTGYYLTAVLGELTGSYGIAFDLSKFAARRAARAHEAITAVVADTWKPWPVRSASAAVVLDVFAPRNATEFHRVLRPGGGLVVVTPEADHLRELVDVLGLLDVDGAKDERVAAQLDTHFVLERADTVRGIMQLTREQVTHLAGMGPSAYHRATARDEAIGALPEVCDVTYAVRVAVYRPRRLDR